MSTQRDIERNRQIESLEARKTALREKMVNIKSSGWKQLPNGIEVDTYTAANQRKREELAADEPSDTGDQGTPSH